MTTTPELYTTTFTRDDEMLAHHRAGRRGVLPASVQLELALVAVFGRRPAGTTEIGEVSFVRPITADAPSVPVSVSLERGTPTRFTLRTGEHTASSGIINAQRKKKLFQNSKEKKKLIL